MIRPELREIVAALGTFVAGLWVASFGGWLLGPIGGTVMLLAAIWMLMAWRRAHFAGPATDPGLIEVDEGRIAYFGALEGLGGFVALDDLVEIRLIAVQAVRYWRLKTADGQAMLVPAGAAGSAGLYDAFSTLPGIDMARLTAALGGDTGAQALWTRPGSGSIDSAAG